MQIERMWSEFVIPLQRDDLRQRTAISQYVVDEVHPIRILPFKFQESRVSFRTKGPVSIMDDFDIFYSILKEFNNASMELKEDAWEHLLKVLEALVKELAEVLERELEGQQRQDLLNTVKMLCYLVCQFVELFELELCDTQVATVKGRSRSNKKSVMGSLDWDWERERGVGLLCQLMQLNVHRLWDPPVLEDEFISLLTGCCYKLMENPASVRSKGTRDHMFHMLAVFVKKYNHAFSCSLKMLQLLQHFEHLVSPLAQAVQVFVEEYGMKNIVGEILRELGRMDVEGLARDLSGTRAYSAFLVELAERVPATILPSISLLIHFLDEEPYTMRNAVLAILGELVVQVLNKDELEPKLKDARNQYLDNLEDHMFDTNAFVRSRTLQIWVNIVNAGAMPISRLHHVLEVAVGRLKDKSSQVRKNAMQFATASLKTNPFAAKFSLEEMKENLIKEESKLKEMMPDTPPMDDRIPAGDPIADKELWAAIEEELLLTVKDLLRTGSDSTGDMIPEEQTMTQNLGDDAVLCMELISNLLRDRAYKDAVRLLQAAREAFPAEPVFSFQQADSQESEDPLPRDSQEEEENDSRRAASIVSCLQDIFLGHQQVAALRQAAQFEPGSPTGSQVASDVAKQQVLVKYLQDSLHFVQEIQNGIPVICQLLGSKTSSDVLEAVNFFVTGYEFGISNAMTGIRRMLSRIWASEAPIKDAVVSAYKRLYLKPQGRDSRSRAVAIVKSLSPLTVGASLGDLTSLEELISEFVRTGEISKHEIQVMWERFTMKITGTTPEESKAALLLLSMAAGADAAIVKSNIHVLVKEGLGQRAETDFVLARYTCCVLLKIAGTNKPKAGTYKEPFRLPRAHDVFQRLAVILVNGAKMADNDQWIPLAAQAVNVIYRLAEQPDATCGDMMKQLASEIMRSSAPAPADGSGDNGTGSQTVACSNALLTRFLALAGQVAFSHMVHLDTAVFCELKRRSAPQEESKAESKATKTPKAAKGSDETSTDTTVEEEMGLAGASAEDVEAEYIRRICEAEIVTGDNLLGVLRPLIVAVINNPTKFSDPDIQAAAAMTLAKFMMVSSEFCESHLQLLFTVLEKSAHTVIRANSIIALGDLTVRFPNMVEPWTPHLYKRLRDPSPQVRKNTVQVLTHLILKNMLKVKGYISEMATCIVDHDERIAGLAKLFFHELAKKGNAVYNVMPDIISRLSDPDAGIDEENFQVIMRYLFSFIQKDKQCESLVEKLCHRFRTTTVERQWQDLAFCMHLLSYSDKSLRKLQENFTCFADKLGDEQIYGYFLAILASAKKFMKPQTKTQIDELEERIEQCHSKGAEEADTAYKAHKAITSARGKKGGRTPHKSSSKTPGRRGRARSGYPPVQDDSDADSEPEEPRALRRGEKRRTIVDFSSDDDSESDAFEKPKGKVGMPPKNGDASSDTENQDPNIHADTGGTGTQKGSVQETSQDLKVVAKATQGQEEEPPSGRKRRHKSVNKPAAQSGRSLRQSSRNKCT